MNTPLKYGAIMAVAGFLLNLTLYLVGLHDTAEKFATSQWIQGVGGTIITVAILALAMREKRAQTRPDANWGYGSALGTGVLVTLVAAILGAVGTYVYAAFINTEFGEVNLQFQVMKWEQAGKSASEIEAGEKMTRGFMTPVIMSLFGAVFGFLFCTVLSLIVAIFFRKRTVTTEAEPLPPAFT
jgi:hypothetical protein